MFIVLLISSLITKISSFRIFQFALLAFGIISPIFIKYAVCKDFVKNLAFQNDEILQTNGGVHKWLP